MQPLMWRGDDIPADGRLLPHTGVLLNGCPGRVGAFGVGDVYHLVLHGS